jgi:hypothetical protein
MNSEMVPAQPEDNPKPEVGLAVCPACKHKHPNPVEQCAQCGIIFSKWKSPEQRQAEARLEALARQEGAGFPTWVKVALFVLIGFPAAVLFIPEVETFIRGGKIQYNLSKGQEFQTRGSSLLGLKSQGSDLSHTGHVITTLLKTTVMVTDSDTGNNSTVNTNFSDFEFQGVPGTSGDIIIPGKKTDKWAFNKSFNRTGKELDLGFGVAAAQQQARAAQHMMNLRAQSMARYQYGMEGEYQEEEKPPELTLPEKIINGSGRNETAILALNNILKYPKKRVRKGHFWRQPININTSGGCFVIKMSPELQVTVKGFKRSGSTFNTILGIQGPTAGSLVAKDDSIADTLNELKVQGFYEGTAHINYKTGMIQKWDGSVVLRVSGSDGKVEKLKELLGVYQEGPATIYIQQKIEKI